VLSVEGAEFKTQSSGVRGQGTDFHFGVENRLICTLTVRFML